MTTARSLAKADLPEPWFIEDSPRAEDEFSRLKSAGWEPEIVEELRAGGVFAFELRLPVAEKLLPVRLLYPPGFPHVAPVLAAPTVQLDRHQHPWLRALCLLSGQRAWRADRSGVDIVAEAIELLEGSLHDPGRLLPEESDAPEPASFYFLYHARALIVPPVMQDLEWFRGRWGTFAAQPLHPGGPTLVTEIRAFGAQPIPALAAGEHLTALWAGQSQPTFEGVWFWLDAAPPFGAGGRNRDQAMQAQLAALRSTLESHYADVPRKVKTHSRTDRGRLFAAVYPEEAGTRGQFVAGWMAVEVYRDRTQRPPLERFCAYRPIYWPNEGELNGSPQLAILRNQHAMVVGCGTLGSSIALELARAGIGRLTLVDPDVLSAANLPRHEGTVADLGVPKVVAVERQIAQHAPWTQVITRGDRVGAVDVADATAAWEDYGTFVTALAACDLVIDATAEPQATNLLNALAIRYDIPYLIAWAMGGAWGGRLIRVRAGASACYECVGWTLPELPDAPEPPHDPNAIRYPQGCAHPSFAGAGFETKSVALAAVRLAISTLVPAHPDFPADHYVLAYRTASTQLERNWVPVQTSRTDRCTVCGSVSGSTTTKAPSDTREDALTA